MLWFLSAWLHTKQFCVLCTHWHTLRITRHTLYVSYCAMYIHLCQFIYNMFTLTHTRTRTRTHTYLRTARGRGPGQERGRGRGRGRGITTGFVTDRGVGADLVRTREGCMQCQSCLPEQSTMCTRLFFLSCYTVQIVITLHRTMYFTWYSDWGEHACVH